MNLGKWTFLKGLANVKSATLEEHTPASTDLFDLAAPNKNHDQAREVRTYKLTIQMGDGRKLTLEHTEFEMDEGSNVEAVKAFVGVEM